jgi:ribosomal protein L31E
LNRIDNYLECMVSRPSDRTKYNAMKFVKDFINKHKLTDEFLIDYCYNLEHNNPRESGINS